MAGRTLFLGDPHLGSENTAKWRGFESVEEHDEAIMDSIVSELMSRDTLVLAGDIDWRGGDHFDECFERACIKKFGGMINVTVRVVMGNHDKYNSLRKSKCITSFHGSCEYGSEWKEGKVVVTHIPVHPDCLDRWVVNVHGHLHEKLIDDPRYINCSWEQNERPILLEDVVESMRLKMKPDQAYLKTQCIGGIRFQRDFRKTKFYQYLDGGNDKSGKLELLVYTFHHIYAKEAVFKTADGKLEFSRKVDGYQKHLPHGIFTDKLRAARYLLHTELQNLRMPEDLPTPMSEEEAEFERWCTKRSKYLIRKVLLVYPELELRS